MSCRFRLSSINVKFMNFKTGKTAVVTCEIKSFRNYFSLRRISFQRLETCLKFFQNYFARLINAVRE